MRCGETRSKHDFGTDRLTEMMNLFLVMLFICERDAVQSSIRLEAVGLLGAGKHVKSKKARH